ncbi:MAG: Gfo/Idh/MocA family oxidoreductase [Puniceicoccales bacterium]|jgi:predicted dehydrogenase|nr:Gfo/Idh/MocA family oxidoreductase [Puniceicoccales bacterium]
MENTTTVQAGPEGTNLSRRRFLLASALTGAGLALAPRSLNAQNANVPSNRASGNPINIGIVGVGAQGSVLLSSLEEIYKEKKIPFTLKAVCDVYRQRAVSTSRREQANGHQDVKAYYSIEEMLSQAKDIDAVFVATPDHWHARNTIAALEAGKHVYCEKMMARTADEGRQMVLTSQKTGKLLQIGHQRRSNPNYRFFMNVLLGKFNFLGDITNATGQWNRSVSMSQDIKVAPSVRKQITKDILARTEFEDAHQFFNWRWFKAYSNGPISDLGAHQIDIFNWVLGRPRSVIAAGGNDYYSVARRNYKPREWYDNVMCIFDYDHIPGRNVGEVARAYYQVLTTSSSGGGYFENFMGDRGSLKISENASNIKAYPEAEGKELFAELVRKGALTKEEAPKVAKKTDGIADARASAAPDAYDLTSRLGQKRIHQFHIENFFNAINGRAKLNCDGAHAFESEAPIFRINEAVQKQTKIVFTEDDFSLTPKNKQPAEGPSAKSEEKKPA